MSQIRRKSRLPHQSMDDERVIVDARGQAVHMLNATGARIWDLLESWTTEADLIETLHDEFDAPDDAIRADVTSFLRELRALDLVEQQ